MEIRELKARDIKTLAHILGKLKAASVGDLFGAIEAKTADPMQVGLSIFRIVAADLTDDLYSWLADLAGKTVEEFDEMSVSAPAEIVKALVARGDFADFFGQATRWAEKSSPPGSTISYPLDTAGPTKS